MIDRTAEFVKAVKQARKDVGIVQKSSILLSKTAKPSTSFGKHSKEIVSASVFHSCKICIAVDRENYSMYGTSTHR